MLKIEVVGGILEWKEPQREKAPILVDKLTSDLCLKSFFFYPNELINTPFTLPYETIE